MWQMPMKASRWSPVMKAQLFRSQIKAQLSTTGSDTKTTCNDVTSMRFVEHDSFDDTKHRGNPEQYTAPQLSGLIWSRMAGTTVMQEAQQSTDVVIRQIDAMTTVMEEVPTEPSDASRSNCCSRSGCWIVSVHWPLAEGNGLLGRRGV